MIKCLQGGLFNYNKRSDFFLNIGRHIGGEELWQGNVYIVTKSFDTLPT